MYQEWSGLIDKSKNGDLKAKEEVLNRLLPLIISSIKRYYNRRELYEELIQEGNICILEAIENFDREKEVYFLGYIKLQLRYLYLNKNRERVHLSLNVKIGEKQEEEILNTIASDEEETVDSMIQAETIKELKLSLDYLSQRQREVVILFYANRKSIREIADMLSISYRTVVNTKTRALEKLKEELGKVKNIK